MDNPKVSIIIPVYNDADCLRRAIESAINQTYKNTEIIVVNDGSNDDGATEAVALSFGAAVRYFVTENGGAGAARNVGIEKASGAYIAFLDSDDAFKPEKLAIQIEYMQKEKILCSHTSYNRVYSDGVECVMDTSAYRGRIYPQIIMGCSIAMPTVVLRAEVLKNNRFRTDIRIAEDICLWIDIAYEYDFGHISIPLTDVHVGENSHALSETRQIVGLVNILGHVTNDDRYSTNFDEIERLINKIRRQNRRRWRFATNPSKKRSANCEMFSLSDALRNFMTYSRSHGFFAAIAYYVKLLFQTIKK